MCVTIHRNWRESRRPAGIDGRIRSHFQEQTENDAPNRPQHAWCVAVCCSVLQCVAVCCSVFAVCCSVLQQE